MVRIVPSVASCEPTRVAEELARLGRCDSLHLDIEDGNFVPNITFGEKMIAAVRQITDLPLNAHLMVTDPCRYIDLLAENGVKEAAIHYESADYPARCLEAFRARGISPGLAVNFKTGVEQLVPYIPCSDFFLVMTSEPDGRGQEFSPSALGRIRRLSGLVPREKKIWVDGGIGGEQLPLVCAAGARVVVMGRAIFGAAHPQKKLEEWRRAADRSFEGCSHGPVDPKPAGRL